MIATPIRTHALPTLEDLETRRMMAAVMLEDGILQVRGDANKPNNVLVTLSKGKLQVTAGRAKLAVAVANVLAISVHGGAKADVIDVSPLVKLEAYIDAKSGHDQIRTGRGSDTVIGGGGNDRIINRGGKDQIYGGGGKNLVTALKEDVVYAGKKSQVTGAKNRSLTEKTAPVIPPPPAGKSEAQQPIQQEPDPTETDPVSPVTEEPPVTPVVEQVGDPVVPPVNEPTGPQAPDGVNTGGEQPQNPPPVVEVGPTLYARDFGAKFDGVTDDGPAIQAALNAVPATGGTVVIDGVAAVGFKALKLVNRERVTIRGAAPGDGFVSLPTPAGQAWNFWSGVITLTNCKNCTVKWLTVDAAKNTPAAIALSGCTDTLITGNTISHTAGGYGAIGSTGGTRNRFSDNQITDTHDTSRGMWIGNVHPGELEVDPVVERNTILRASASGIAGIYSGAVIQNNTVRDCQGSGIAISSHGALADAISRDSLIKGNVLTGNAFHGVQSDVFAGQPYTQRITVEDNICEGNVNAGIYAVRAQGWVIRNNTCRDNKMVGIMLGRTYDTVLQGNHCISTGRVGSYLQIEGISAVSNGELAGNAQDQADGNKLTLRNIRIVGNICKGNKLSGIKLISISGGTADGISITENTCSEQVWDGILIVNPEPGVLTNIAVSGNVTTGNGRIDANIRM